MTTHQSDADAALAALQVERDQLAAQLAATEVRTRKAGRFRRFIVVVLILLSCITLVSGVVGVWARRNFLDTNRFVDRVGPVVEDPAVQQALTSRLTAQIIVAIDPRKLFEEVLPERGQLLAVPLAGAVQGFVHDRVEAFVASDAFAKLWVAAVESAHETAVKVLKGKSQVVEALDGKVQLNLIPVVDAILKRITAASPEIFGRTVNIPDVTFNDIPDAAVTRLEDALGVNLSDDFGQVTVYDHGKLKAAQDGVRLFDRVVVILLPVGLALAALALWLSRRRRRTLLQLSVGIALGMVVIRRVSFRVHDEVAALAPTAQGRRATGVVLEQFLHPLATFALWTFGAVALIAVVAVLTGPYPWVVSLRRRVAAVARGAVSATSERAQDEQTVAWIGAHRDALRIAGVAAGLLVLWTADLSWIGLFVVLGVIAAYEAVVYRVGTTPPSPSPSS